ncbi:MAG: FCD domain-containing protein [Arenibacterium sp.]
MQTAQKKPRAADGIVTLFEQKILNGSLKAGDPLPPEREIVQRHEVSRTVVREALRILASKGLIVTRPGYRPVVAQPGYDAAIGAVGSIVTQLLGQPGGVWNLFEVRIRMEASLVREAAAAAKAEHIRALEDALAANGAAVDNSARFFETDTAFHGILYDIPGNPVLPAIHRAYTDWLSPQWSKMPRDPTRNQSNFEAHTAIFDAILRRDPDAAEAALRRHLGFAWDQVRNTFHDL